tara:strand:+ start:96 stop:1298 length:1203 start_codon:yes stop_codon:yes gene_type:complete
MKSLGSINFNKFFKYYLVFICFSSIFFMSRTYQLDVNNSMGEWLINYQGGFGRRGLLGELFTQLSIKINFPIRKLILYFLYFTFITYYSLIYLFFRNVKKNKLIIVSILSPLFILFPLAELEALGRKDILIPTFFIIYCIIFSRTSFFGLSLILLICFPILLLTHEVSIFYLPFFLIVLMFKNEKFNILRLLSIIFISAIFVLIIYILSNSAHSSDQIKMMCDHMKNVLNDKCGLGAYVLNRALADNIAELGGNITQFIRNFFIFIFGFSALVILIQNSYFNNQKINIISKYFNFKFLVCIVFLPTLIPFAIAVDWGRWFNLSCTMLTLFYFFCHKNENIILNDKIKILEIFSYNFLKSKIFFFILVFIICFSWNPKAVYHEDIGSFPVYRIVTKIIKYY